MEPGRNSSIYQKASFKRRFLAFLIDTVLIYIFLIVLNLFFSPLKQYFIPINILIGILYGSIFITYKGATPGKMLLKIKVVSISYQSVSFSHALLRESIGKLLSGIVFDLGYFWIIIDKKNQAWHDKIAKTLVVRLDNKNNLIPIENENPLTLKRKSVFTLLFLISGSPIIFSIFFLVIYIFFFRPFQINGNAMYPNYQNGQYYISSLNYGNLNKGDVIFFKAPPDTEKDYIKRIIALPGDTISIRGGSVYLNGNLLNENAYLKPDVKTYTGAFLKEGESMTIPPGEYFVMGDNRSYSSDSREWGFVPKNYIISKVSFCYYKCK
mgnify:CR=1 FL=1